LGFRPYRRWGISPRPENIGRPEWANLPETMAEGRDASKPFAMGKRHIPMPPARFAAMPAPDLIRGEPQFAVEENTSKQKAEGCVPIGMAALARHICPTLHHESPRFGRQKLTICGWS